MPEIGRGSSGILIRDSRLLAAKLARIREAGPGGVHIVSDWDRTLTTARTVEGRDQSTYAIIYDGGYLGPEYKRRSVTMYRRYRQAERSADLPPSAKGRLMASWWTEHFDLMVESGFSMDVIDRAIAGGAVRLRPGALDLLDIANQHRIPLLILSAGIKPFIDRFLDHHGRSASNITVVANGFDFGNGGCAAAYHTPLIHSLNKHRIEIKPRDHLKGLAGRRNLVLLGDNVEDIQAAKGIESDCVLSYGFAESSEHPNINAFLAAYDVVIPDDGPMTAVVDLLRETTGAA